MKKTELIFRFQNPNTPTETANFFLQTMIKANEKRIDEMILHTVFEQKTREEYYEKRRCILPCIYG